MTKRNGGTLRRKYRALLFRRSFASPLAFLFCVAFLAGYAPESLGAGVGPAGSEATPVPPAAIGQDMMRTQEKLLEEENPAAPPGANGEDVVSGQSAPARPAPNLAPQQPGVHFFLKQLIFSPSAFLKPEDLNAIARHYVGLNSSMADLQSAMDEIDDLYLKHGIVTGHAMLPPQKIQDGIVHIELVEGKVGQYKVTGNSYTNNDFFTSRMSQSEGDTVDTGKLESDLSTFNRLYDMQARATLQPGASFGLTDIQLSVIEPKQDVLDLFADNEAYPSTGTYEGGFYYRHIGLLGIDDHATAYMTGGVGALNGTASYDVPFNQSGGRIGISYGRSTTDIVNGVGSNLSTGQSQNGALNVAQPIWLGKDWMLTASGTFGGGSVDNYLSNALLSDETDYKAGGGLTFSQSSRKSAFNVSANALGVRGFFDGMAPPATYYIYTGNFSWMHSLTDTLTASLQGSGQVTPQHNVTSDELFQIGGVTTVRGYSQGFLAGDDGYYVDGQLTRSLEFLTKGLAAFVFLDRGMVVTATEERYGIYGTGGGFSWSPCRFVSTDLTLSAPLNHIEDDQDGYEIYARVVFHVL